jgi:hypothetical protein
VCEQFVQKSETWREKSKVPKSSTINIIALSAQIYCQLLDVQVACDIVTEHDEE